MKTLGRFGSLSLALALALGAQSARADDVQVSETARQHFKTGVAYLTDPDGARYEDAYREFKAAYADSPSWKILGNLGITSMKLERDGEAIEAFEKYLAGGGDQIDPAERSQMERDLMTTKAGVVWLDITIQPEGASVVDERTPLTGRPVSNQYDVDPSGKLHVGVRRGHHKITARLAGFEDQTWEFDAEPGQAPTHEFKLEKPKPAPAGSPGVTPVGGAPAPAPVMERPISTPVIIGAAATGALLVGSGVVGVLAMGKGSQYKDKNDGDHVAEAQDLRDSGKSLNLIADVLLGGAVVGGVVTTILYLNRPEVPASGDARQDTGKLRFSPAVGANGGYMVVSGKF